MYPTRRSKDHMRLRNTALRPKKYRENHCVSVRMHTAYFTDLSQFSRLSIRLGSCSIDPKCAVSIRRLGHRVENDAGQKISRICTIAICTVMQILTRQSRFAADPSDHYPSVVVTWFYKLLAYSPACCDSAGDDWGCHNAC